MRRRDALIIGGLFATAIAIPPVLRRLPSEFVFEPLPGFDGFRRLQGGAASGGIDPFVGLTADRLPAPADPVLPVKPVCQALFGPQGWESDRVPVALFSDFNCPYCRGYEAKLIELEATGAPIRLIWHEMPLLGPSSQTAARAVIASDNLGAGRAAREYLWTHAMPPGPVGLRRLAQALNIDAGVLIREAESQRVTAILSESLALGARLGIFGTPGTVIGRTLIVGELKDADLRKLIGIERSEPRDICL